MSRALTFWTPETVEFIKRHYVAAAVPTWLCRSKTPEGDYLRSAGVDKQWVTSSGYMTCLSPSGKMLGQHPDAKTLKKFLDLPEAERRPGAIKFDPLEPNEVAIPSPPAGGLVLQVHARFLSRDKSGRLRPATIDDFPLMPKTTGSQKPWALFLEPNTEYLWLTRDEWQAMIPSAPVKGATVTPPASVADRLARFHLTPQRATTSEGGVINKKSLKSAKLILTVDDVGPKRIQMSLTGHVHWGTEFDAAKATTPNGPLGQGFETHLVGVVEYDREKNAITRFDVMAPGQVWGRWGDANGKSLFAERPGRTPFGFALELADPDNPTHRIAPGGNPHYATERSGYFAKAK